jgi:hypothetical protein
MNRVAALRASLLMSLGVVAPACGGTSERSPGTESNNGNSGTGGREGGSAGREAQGGEVFVVAGTGGTGVPSIVTMTCSSPVYDALTGFERCQEGYSHRVSRGTCHPVEGNEPTGAGGTADVDVNELPRAPEGAGTVPCGYGARAGEPDPCAQFQYGYCHIIQTGVCKSGCFTDDDCGTGRICECGSRESPTGGVCRQSDCMVDADCGTGLLCASYLGGCGEAGYACQRGDDECRIDADCANRPMVGASAGSCVMNATHRTCSYCVAGRPFLVATEIRTAPLAARGDWSSGKLAPSVDHLTPSERAELTAHWSRLGQMEHASIAAFARFQLQLLALGAPAELVESCTAALADETAHTKLCFALASVYAGRSLGPGPLDIAGSLEASSLSDIVDLVLVEGCFGEASAALEAFEAAESAADPVIRAAYSRIAEDEQRHAELAFRFVRWALQRGGAEVAVRIAAALAAPPSTSTATREVTLPCLRALLDATGAVTPPELAAARAPASPPVI